MLRTPYDRVTARVAIDPATGCWAWSGATNSDGYGTITIGSRRDGTRRTSSPHIVTYEHAHGPIPSGQELDHLCRNHACCNPAHLEAVPHAVNVRRGTLGSTNRNKTHCKYGHPFDAENTRVYENSRRSCRTCNRLRLRRLASTARRSIPCPDCGEVFASHQALGSHRSHRHTAA